MEKYLTVIKNPMFRQAMTRLRISNHTLFIESGRHTNPPIPPQERLCTLCNLRDVEDEPHFLITCSIARFSHLRHNMLATANSINSCFKYLSSKEKSIYILTSTNRNLIRCTAKYIYNAMKLRSSLLSPVYYNHYQFNLQLILNNNGKLEKILRSKGHAFWLTKTSDNYYYYNYYNLI